MTHELAPPEHPAAPEHPARTPGAGGMRTRRGGPPPRRRQPPEVRRKMIVAAARTVIAERGLHATTVRDIAAAAGVAVGTVTYHFTGMADVLAEVLQTEMTDYSAPIMSAAAGASSGAAGLAVIVDGLIASGARAEAHWKLWLDFWALAAHYPVFSSWQSRVYRDLHELTGSVLSRGHEDGTLAVADPAAQAVEFVALLDGLVVQSYLPGAALTPAQARARLHRYVATALGPVRRT